MRYALLLITLLMITGCASQTVVQDTYRYDDIDPSMEGNWGGYAKSTVSEKDYTFMLNLERGKISSIVYINDECAGRLKYQRTENDLHFLFLEQIDVDKNKVCDVNGYVRFTPGVNNDNLIYTRHNMQGKAVSQGLMTRKQ